MRFPNKAGDHEDTDAILTAELNAAGIQTMQQAEGKGPEFMAEMMRRNSGEVKTSIMGVLNGWKFERAWYYWMASGPGIELEAADRLHEAHGKTVRVAGHGGCPSPREWFKGLAVGHYHVDDSDGLKALADTIKALTEPPAEVCDEVQHRYFAVLQSAIRDRSIPIGEPGNYKKTFRDDPAANEFRVQHFNEWGERNTPLGSNREVAENMVHCLNASYNFGLVHAKRLAKNPAMAAIQVGRMGHINRNEEYMP